MSKKGQKGGWRKSKEIAWDHECRTRDQILERDEWDALRLERSGASKSSRELLGPCDVVARHRYDTLFIECKRSRKSGGKSITLRVVDLEDVGKMFEVPLPWGKGIKIMVLAGATRVRKEGVRNCAVVPLDFLLDLIEDRYSGGV